MRLLPGAHQGGLTGRKILFVTTDQQRYDSLGCNGGTVARTPVADGLAAAGVNYRRAMNHNVVCMPARSTMITGQYPRTHGVYANGVPLPADAPSVASYLNEHGYRTALTAFSDGDPVTGGGDAVFHRRVPGARGRAHVTIEGGGHFLREDLGPRLARVVADFVTTT